MSSSYAPFVLLNTPSLYWRLGDVTNGDLLDATGGGNLGVLYGGYGQDPGLITSDPDTCVLFDGTTGCAAESGAATPAPQVCTIEVWIKTTTTQGGKIAGFGDGLGANSVNYDRHLYMTAAGKIIFGVYNSGFYIVFSAGSYNDGAVHHVVGVLSPGALYLYIDGVMVGLASVPSLSSVGYLVDAFFPSSPPSSVNAQSYNGYWHIGGDTVSGWPLAPPSPYFDGDIDEFAIYPTVLSASAIAKNFTAGINADTTPPPILSSTGNSTLTNLLTTIVGATTQDADITQAILTDIATTSEALTLSDSVSVGASTSTPYVYGSAQYGYAQYV